MTNFQIGLGAPNTAWAHYNIYEYPVLANGAPTKTKAVVRNDTLVAFAGNSYTLLPNEEALKLANQAAELVGFKPFFEKIGNAANNVYGRNVGHVLVNNRDTQIHALYIPREYGDVNIAPENPDEVYVGVDVQNSIDGRKSFGVNIFTFRRACQNGVLFGAETMMNVHYAHTKNLEKIIANLKNLFVEQMDTARIIKEGYTKLTEIPVTTELLTNLNKSRIPKKLLPDYVTGDETRVNFTGDYNDVTAWDIYNDVTAKIWHSEDITLRTKEAQFNRLHKIISPLQIARAR